KPEPDTQSATANRPAAILKNLKSEIYNLKSQQHIKRAGGEGRAPPPAEPRTNLDAAVTCRGRSSWHCAGPQAGARAVQRSPAPPRSLCTVPRTAAHADVFPRSLRRSRNNSRNRPARDAQVRR